MKKISILFSFLCIVTLASAQDEYKAHNEGWLVKIEEAFALSQETGKPIMANFTGSDWCGWCRKLTNDVFSKDDFKTWADDNVVLLELDFPRRKKLPDNIQQQNYSLQ
ncbi:MAG: thioredoxin family protein, partial [Bacteroidota bacterium]